MTMKATSKKKYTECGWEVVYWFPAIAPKRLNVSGQRRRKQRRK
jgi:hypothetical protein